MRAILHFMTDIEDLCPSSSITLITPYNPLITVFWKGILSNHFSVQKKKIMLLTFRLSVITTLYGGDIYCWVCDTEISWDAAHQLVPGQCINTIGECFV